MRGPTPSTHGGTSSFRLRLHLEAPSQGSPSHLPSQDGRTSWEGSPLPVPPGLAESGGPTFRGRGYVRALQAVFSLRGWDRGGPSPGRCQARLGGPRPSLWPAR